MFVSGFTFIRNAIKYDYPIVEAIQSVLPLVDEMIVAVGNSDDDTRKLITGIGSDKIKIIDTIWDDSLRKGGRVLAVETDKAFDAISEKADWAIYIQGDEVMHEKDYNKIRNGMLANLDKKEVQGLLFKYVHFYGSYDYVGDASRWYPKEIRIIRNDKQVRSFRDAQGFQRNGKRLHVKEIDAFVYHYGWVKPPDKQLAKQKDFGKLWHGDEFVNEKLIDASAFDYSQIDTLHHFKGTHPAVMKKRIAEKNWSFDFDPTQKKVSLKFKFINFVQKHTGWRIGEYRNYVKL